jgi:hypothetical protein
MKFLFILSLFIFVSPSARASVLAPFETDYCTNYPEGTPKHPDLWKDCCLVHDMTFWAGGTKQNRLDADHALRSCIENVGAPEQARIMYFAVRAGSYSPIKYPKGKWNNGWDDRGDFQALTPEDIKLIKTELSSGHSYISEDIKNSFINLLHSRLD